MRQKEENKEERWQKTEEKWIRRDKWTWRNIVIKTGARCMRDERCKEQEKVKQNCSIKTISLN